jgi:hypothetical protein
MPNANYTKGVILEREIVNLFKSVGCVAARTAGSHGKYDLYVIGTKEQLDLGWDKLEIEKFRPTLKGWVRQGKTHNDWLFPMFVEGPGESALFIQCKRKGK